MLTDITEKYELLDELGRGISATVYKGRLKATGEEFAVKVIDKTQLSSLATLKREVALLKQLSHPNIICLKEVIHTPKNVNIVTDLAEGGELFKKIAQIQFYAEDDAKQLVRQLVSAISYCHSLDIVHRDLKPENLLLSSKGDDAKLMIADFGVSRIMSEAQMQATSCGTPSYVAPEVIKAEKYGRAVDMWSIGVITYVILCGYPPFYSDNIQELFQQIMAADYRYYEEDWDKISKEAKNFIDRLLVLDPEQRMTAEQALGHEWVRQSEPKKKSKGSIIRKAKMDEYLTKKEDVKTQAMSAAKMFLKGSPAPDKTDKMRSHAPSRRLRSSSFKPGAVKVQLGVQKGLFTDEYQLLEKLGEGAFAAVHKCQSKSTGVNFAVKVIDKLKAGNDMESIGREVSILQQLQHPNVIRLQNTYDNGDNLYLVMEIATGGELFNRIAEKVSYQEADAIPLVRQLISAIHYMHGKGIVHRDLKPENLLLSNDKDDATLKVADFGLSKMVDAEILMATACGTPTYIAPEVLQAQPYGPEVDMWSVGVITYIILCGYPPFYAEDLAELFDQILAADFEFFDDDWGSVSHQAKDFISNLLTVDPTRRLTSQQALNHPWVKPTATPAPTTRLKTLRSKLTQYNTSRRNIVPEDRKKLQPLALPHQITRHFSIQKINIQSKYELTDTLGSGAFATVKLAVHKATGKKYAVKMINKADVGNDMESIDREITILKNLNHPNIVLLKETFDSPQYLYIVMELCEGGELFNSIAEKVSYSEKEAAGVIVQLLQAIDYLHSQNIVHRDLKPENLLLSDKTDRALIKVADFGLSKMVDQNKLLATSCGTPGYIAPEILRAEGYGPGVDMWAVGVIAYVLLAGYPPFYSEDLAELFDQIMEADFEFYDEDWGKISSEAKDFIKKLLVADINKRLSAKQALLHPFLKMAPTTAVPAHHKLKEYAQTRKDLMATKRELQKQKEKQKEDDARLKKTTLQIQAIKSQSPVPKKLLRQSASIGDASLTTPMKQMYNIGTMIGSGPLGTCFNASKKDDEGAGKFVMKAFPLSTCSGSFSELKDQFETLRALSHDGIVPYIDVFQDMEQIHISTTFMSGGGLFDFIQEKDNYDESDACTIITQVLQMLQYMHDKGVVHRNLKPENLLIEAQTTPFVVKTRDWGYAHIFSKRQLLVAACSSPSYSAPELIQAQQFGPPADIWSVGVIAFALLVGYPPFFSEDPSELYSQIISAEYEFHPDYWEDISKEAKEFVQSCLVLDPSERPDVATALNHPWIKKSVSSRPSPTPKIERPLSVLKKACVTQVFDTNAEASIALHRARNKRESSLSAITVHADTNFESIYTLGKEIGTGSFSTVHECQHKDTSLPWAVKIIDETALEDPSQLENEISIVCTLSHPNIIRFKEIFRASPMHHIVMERATGDDLYTRLSSRGPFQEVEAVLLARNLLKALMYLHHNGIVHRDLRCENIIFLEPSENSTIKIIDFGGAARVPSDGSKLTDWCGQPHYVSPEVLSDEGYTTSVDIWAFGIVLYIILSGRPPFDDDDISLLFGLILECDLRFPADQWGRTSREAKTFVSGFLVVDPAKRFQIKEALAHPWLRGLTNKSMVVEKAQPTSFVHSSGRINPGQLRAASKRALMSFKK